MAKQIIVTQNDYGIELETQFVDDKKKPLDITDYDVRVKIIYDDKTIDTILAGHKDSVNGIAYIVLEKEHLINAGLHTSVWSVVDEDEHVTAQENVYYFVKDVEGSEDDTPTTDLPIDADGVLNKFNEIDNNLFELTEQGNVVNEEIDSINETLSVVNEQLDNKMYYFNTVADMKKCKNNVKVGSSIITLGFHDINDGGGATYQVLDSLTSNECNIIALDNGLFAKMINDEPKKINVLKLGIKRFELGIDDTMTKILDIIPYGGTLYFPSGEYHFTQPIIPDRMRVNFLGDENNCNDNDRAVNGTRFIFNNPTNDSALLNLSKNGKCFVRNIYVISNAIDLKVNRENMSNGTTPIDVFTKTSNNTNVVGIRIPSYGCQVDNCIVYGCNIGFEFNFFTIANNCQAFNCSIGFDCYNDGTYTGLHGFTLETGIRINGSLNQFANCRFDEIRNHAVVIKNGNANNFVNCNYDYVQYACYMLTNSHDNYISGNIGRCGTYYAGFESCSQPYRACYISLTSSNYNRFDINTRRPSVKDGSTTPLAPTYVLSVSGGCRHFVLNCYGKFTSSDIYDTSLLTIDQLKKIVNIEDTEVSCVINYQGIKYVLPNIREINSSNVKIDSLINYT